MKARTNFLNKHGLKDTWDMSEDTRDELMKTHFYYIDNDQGYFVKDNFKPKEGAEDVIYEFLKEGAE